MIYQFRTMPSFDRELKQLSKRYSSIAEDLRDLVGQLQENPFIGTSLGHGVRKIRMAISSKGGGKRGGARVITHTNVLMNVGKGIIHFLSIYDKSSQTSISNKEIKNLLEEADIQ